MWLLCKKRIGCPKRETVAPRINSYTRAAKSVPAAGSFFEKDENTFRFTLCEINLLLNKCVLFFQVTENL